MNRRQAFLAAPLLLAVAALAGCGGSSTPATQSSASVQPLAGASGTPGTGVRPGGPAASGITAAISGNSLEVQNPQTGQTTVDFTSTTTFVSTQRTTLAAVKVGSCVTATGPVTSSTTTLTASSVSITEPVNGSCASRRPGVGGGSGGFTRPSGAPTPRFSGTPRLASQSSAAGQVTGVSAKGFAVKGFMRTFGAGAVPRPSASPVSSSITVTVAATTVYTSTGAATQAALKVGLCVTAVGTTGATGAVTARAIAISPPVNGSCLSGFGRRFAGLGGSGGTGG